LDGGAGEDILKGGAGADAMVFDGNDLLIDGGDGADSLKATGNIDLTLIANDRVRNIESIDLGTSSGNYAVTLTDADVAAMNADRTAVIQGGLGDTANVIGEWVQGETVTDNSVSPPVTYVVYRLNDATLKIQQGVVVNYTGTDGRDLLTAGAGNQVLDGRMGSDVLNGGAGSDVMIGGRGEDVFVYDLEDTSYTGGILGGLDNENDTVKVAGGGVTVDLSSSTGHLVVTSPGSASPAKTETTTVTFVAMQEGETLSLGGLIYTAPVGGATGDQVAAAFASHAVNYAGASAPLSGTLAGFASGALAPA
jgi:Ca2+-binding RTX toxin-like protein